MLAGENDFEVIPIVNEGHIRTFWRRKTRRVHAITTRHRVQYFADVGSLLGRLVSREAQFVCYGDEVVGLVDLSDLNRPLARLVWLHPILELEHAIFSRMSKRGISDEIVRQALGSSAKKAEERQSKARKQDLSLPLVAFLQFPHVLKAAQGLNIVSVTSDEIRLLNDVRRRSAHGVARPVERVTDGKQLVQALQICMRLVHEVQ